MSDMEERQLVTSGRVEVDANGWRSLVAFAAAKLHPGGRWIKHGPIETDLAVFYIGVGDQLDDDRRRVRPA
jgi:hypothetical protein